MVSEWYAVQAKPHKEFTVRDALARFQDVQSYLPILRVDPVNPRARRVRPFFPGYLFVYADLAQVGTSAIQWTPGLARLLGAEGQPYPIPARTIEEIRSRVQAVQDTEALGGGRFQHGDPVGVISGPLQGFEGMFDTHTAGKTRARILVQFLGRPTVTEVEMRNLKEVSRR